jgi:DNA-binding NarL/FixJ family response regulator
MHEEVVYAERALQVGARGYVPKSEASSEVIRAIRKVLSGEVYLNEWMTSELIQRMAVHSREPREAIMASLSERELEILQMIGQGRNTHEMARELGVSESTIAALRLRIKHRLGAKDTAELYHRAVEWVNEHEHTMAWRRSRGA